MNNVKLARTFLWALILTAVCSRGYAMEKPYGYQPRSKPASTSTPAAAVTTPATTGSSSLTNEQVGDKLEKAGQEANKQLQSVGSKWNPSQLYDWAVNNLPDVKWEDCKKTINMINGDKTVLQSVSGVVTIAGVEYWMSQCGQYLFPKAKPAEKQSEQKLSIVQVLKAHLTLHNLYTWGAQPAVAIALYRLPQLAQYRCSLPIACLVNVPAVIHYYGLHEYALKYAKENHGKTITAGALVGAGALTAAQYTGAIDARDWYGTVGSTLGSVTNWLNKQREAHPYLTYGATGATVVATAVTAIWKLWPTKANVEKSVVTPATKAEAQAKALQKEAITQMEAAVNGVTLFMGRDNVPTNFDTFAAKNSKFTEIAKELKARLVKLQTMQAAELATSKPTAIADFTAKIKAVQIA